MNTLSGSCVAEVTPLNDTNVGASRDRYFNISHKQGGWSSTIRGRGGRLWEHIRRLGRRRNIDAGWGRRRRIAGGELLGQEYRARESDNNQ